MSTPTNKKTIVSSDVLDLDMYDESTRPIVFKLRSDRKITCEYFENYMTEPRLREFAKLQEAMQESQTVEDAAKIYISHLSFALAKIPNKQNLPYSTPAERELILAHISYQDLRNMAAQIALDLSRPLDEAEPDLSDGPDQAAN